jgi:uncharacterized protein YjbI with pentapeptide repeats
VEFRNVDFKRCGAASASGERRPNKPASGERRPNEPAVAEQACADFREARLEKVVFLSAELDDAIFFGVRATHTAFSEVLASRTNFRMAKLRDVAFSRAWLEEAVFDGARIQDAYFQQGSLHRASLRETHLTSVVFRDTDIEGAAFDGSKAVRVSFPGTAWWLAYGWTDEQIAEFRKSYPPFRYATSSGFTAGMQSREDKLRVASPDDRTQAYALNDLAWYRAVRGAQLEKAEHDVDEALRLLPGNRDLLDTKAFIRMQDRDFGAAAALLEQALGLDEGRDPEFRDLLAKANREHLYRYGLCLQHLGRGDAQKFLRAASLKGYVPTYERVLVAPPPRG